MGAGRGRRWLRAVGVSGILPLLLGPALAGHAATPGGAREGGCDWAMYGYDAGRTMTTACPSAPGTSDVSTLKLAWRYQTSDVVTATPTVVGGTVYAGDWSGDFYAVNLATGKLLWSTVIGPRRADAYADSHTGAYGTITSSAAVATIGGHPMVFVGGGGSLYALDATVKAIPDAKRVLWRADFDPTHPTSHGEVESSPVVWTGAPGGPEVFVGSDANQDSGYAGEGVWALSALTGKVLWHYNPETSDPAAYSAGSHPALYGCGNVWSSPALALNPAERDPRLRAMLYFGTADCPDNSTTACPSDGHDPGCRPGQSYNYAARWSRNAQAMIAVSALDGSQVWSWQAYSSPTGNDDDYGPSAQLFTTSSGRQVVGEANKDGYYNVLDRTTGTPLWRQAETGNGNVQPGFALGGFIGTTAVASIGGHPTVFGGSAINTPITYDSSGNPTAQSSSTLLKNAQTMVAFSGDKGGQSWWAPIAYTYGATSSGNGVVYVGSLDGFLRAFDAKNGLLLWAFPLGAPMSSGAAVVSHGLVVGDGTDESDVEFKSCDRLSSVNTSLGAACKSTPLDQTLNPLSRTGAIYAFTNQPSSWRP